ncbi:hypothetical protein B0H67DRAFT_454092, partial [Lasiosphaeris hirsuta]
ELPPDVVALDFDASGNVVWNSTDPQSQPPIPTGYYPSVVEYHLPPPALPVVTRSQLAVVAHLGLGVDKVVQDGKEATLKYHPFAGIRGARDRIWSEIQILARLPPHPNLLPIQSLVVEELTGLGVVGFTRPFISELALDQQRFFKLRWLREILSVVDLVNLEYGISHQNISAPSFCVNPDTDSLLLLDFNHSAELSSRFDRPERNDIKAVFLMVYFFITRDPNLDYHSDTYLPIQDVSDMETASRRENWIKHPHVELDDEVSVFYDELMAWVRRRGNAELQPAPIRHRIELPEKPKGPHDEVSFDDHPVTLVGHGSSDAYRIRAGRPVLTWQRPHQWEMDPTRPLLATGRYAD